MLLFLNDLTPAIAIGILLAALIGMTVHEFAHNYVGFLMGDDTPKRQGRLTLDPSVHIYWPGFIMFVLIGFGILGTAPINAYKMRNPRWGYLAAVAAGPFSNLLLAILFGILFRVLGVDFLNNNDAVADFLIMLIYFNVLLFLFNLIPLYPLDGWWITLALLPPNEARWWERNAMTTQYIFMGMILLSFVMPRISPLNIIIGGGANAIFRLTTGI